MLSMNIARYLVCILCIVSMLCSGCASIHSSGLSREASWEEFKGSRPEPRYVHFHDRSLTAACADITSYYIQATMLLDRAVDRIENSDVGAKLETIRAEQGEDAFIEALQSLTREERRAYRIYVRSERDDLAVVGGYIQTLTCGITATLLYPYTFMYDYRTAMKASLVLEQYEYAVKSLQWLHEYEALLERAQEHLGR